MEYRTLGKSGLKVSEIGLGGVPIGEADEKTAIAVINRALELGINFIDTAEAYSRGRSEEMVGKAVKGKRQQVIIATKYGHPRTMNPRELGGSRSYTMKAVDASLRRLDTDYIDLYYLHRPDPETPIEETLRALDDLVRAGKVRYIGCSNFAAWQICEARWTSRRLNLEPFIAAQSRYNLLDRSIEPEIAPCCEKYGVGIVPWSPLATGFLTGKYRRVQDIPAGSRLLSPVSSAGEALSEANFAKLARLEAFARERGHQVAELAIAWLLAHPWLSSVIAGASSAEQMPLHVAAAGWKLTAEEMTEVEGM